MDKPNEIVLSSRELHIIVDYPVTGVWKCKISSGNSKGFTRVELVNEISRAYHSIYAEEERTTKTKIVPNAQKKTMFNRHQTDGKYGVWGHDIDDLVLYNVELRKTVDGTLFAMLGIDS